MKIVPITLAIANDFVKKHHRHSGRVVGHKFAIGLEENGELIGVAIAGRPIARNLDKGRPTLEITRVCVMEGYKNASSKLYARAKRIGQLMGYQSIKTYNLKSESGASLRAIGAVPEASVKGGQWDRPKRRRENKAIYEQKKIRWELLPSGGKFE